MFMFLKLYILILSASFTHAIKCFDCQRVPLPRDCNHVTMCGEHEVCDVKQYVSRSGTIFFDVGCIDRLGCDSKRDIEFNTSMEVDDVDGDIPTCHHCCDSDYCNVEGCGSTPLPPKSERGPICFSCPLGTIRPNQCEMLEACSQDQQCSIEPFVSVGGDDLYRSGCKTCIKLETSMLIGRRETCNGCCSTDFCNQNCSSLTPSFIPQTTNTLKISTTTSRPTTSTSRPTTTTSKPTTTTSKPTTTTSKPTTTTSKPTTSTTRPTISTSRPTTSTTPQPTTTSTTIRPTTSTVPSTTTSSRYSPKVLECTLFGYTYLEQFDSCIKPYTDLFLSWQKARDVCIQNGGDLYVSHDRHENTFLGKWISNITRSDQLYYWVGATDTVNEGIWKWVDGTNVRKSYFVEGEPNDYNHNEDCGALHRSLSGLLNDLSCEITKTAFVCEIKLDGNHEVQLPPRRYCHNSDYTYDTKNGICYKVYGLASTSWYDARDECRQHRADLLQLRDTHVEDDYLNIALHGNLDVIYIHQFWLGAYRRPDEKFYWLNGRPVVKGNYHWGVGQPDNYYNAEDCLDFLHFPSGSLKQQYAMNDGVCSSEQHFICEERCPDATYSYAPGLDICYKIHTSHETWTEAQATCSREHADLMEPVTKEQMDFFDIVLKPTNNDIYWMGARRSSTSSPTITWQSSKTSISTELWHMKEPAMAGCAVASWNSQTFTMNILPCDSKHTFVCQYIW
ncbi:hypothetical protein ACF0H5_007180 [Mactra antiquata]